MQDLLSTEYIMERYSMKRQAAAKLMNNKKLGATENRLPRNADPNTAQSGQVRKEEGNMKEKKLEIIYRMVRNGYHLMNRTAEEMASIFTLEELEEFERKHNERREKQ